VKWKLRTNEEPSAMDGKIEGHELESFDIIEEKDEGLLSIAHGLSSQAQQRNFFGMPCGLLSELHSRDF